MNIELKLPYGGISYIAGLFGCSRDTVSAGIKELAEAETLPKNRNRKAGGGRTLTLEKEPDINEVFLMLLKDHTAGDPKPVMSLPNGMKRKNGPI